MTNTNRSTEVPDEPTNRVRALRLSQGLTLDQLSTQIGMALSHLGKIERGGRDLNYQWAVRIADKLGVLPSDLFLIKDGGLSESERKLIDAYRMADPHVQSAFDAFANSLHQSSGSADIRGH